MQPLICIDTKTGYLTRYVGKKRTHVPFVFNCELCGEDNYLAAIEVARMEPEVAGITPCA